ncbi:tripartite tricarboxylate transporter TctB family protein [Pseudoroseicyclus sp. CXY001]|uniref:tripartite tricarboxylate transporter TctB family protein n=1 Tax=Pseudoroseicyclus sp. CXY001 TaxID=3242492 RepID=UPI00358DC817
MQSRDYRDILAGLLLGIAGLAVTIYAWNSYEMGTIRRMGPGMYPFGLGLLMVLLGVIIAVPAWSRSGPPIEVRIYSPLFVLAGVAAFAYVIPHAGLIPAVVAVVAISSLAELKVHPVSLILLIAGLCLLAYLIFGFALGLPIRMFDWSF